MNSQVEELSRLGEGILHYEDANRLAAAFWDRVNNILGYATALVSAATAAIALPTDAGRLAAGFAILTAVLATTLAFFKPAERAAGHRRAWIEFNCLRVELRQASLDGGDESPGTLATFTQQRNRLVASSPQYSQRTFERARTRIADGIYSYSADDGRH